MANPEERAARMGGGYDYGGGGGNLPIWVSGDPLPQPSRPMKSAPAAPGGADGYQMPATRMGPAGYAPPPEQYIARQPNEPFKLDAGAHLDALKRGQFDLKWKSLFFACALVIFGSAVLSVLTLFLTVDWKFGLIQSLYAAVFGLIMVVMDFPRPDSTVDYLRRKQITRYFRFLTLFCGRGCTYLFLSTLSFSMLNDLAGFKFLGYVCGGSVFLVGCLSLYVGISKSYQLKHMRAKLVTQMEQNPQFVKNYMNENSRNPNLMGVHQFQDMARSLGNYDFDEEQAVFIFDAIRGGPIDGEPTLDEGDLLRWAVPNSGESIVIIF